MLRGWAACFLPVLDAEDRPDRNTFVVSLAIIRNRDLLFINGFIGHRVKNLIIPGAIRIIDSRALEQTVRAVAALFEEHKVLHWHSFFIRALT